MTNRAQACRSALRKVNGHVDMAYQGDLVMDGRLASRLTYPNPFSPSGIDFDLPDEARVTLKILDAAGQEITTLIDQVMYAAGTHHIEVGPTPWAQSLSNAQEIYFYRLCAEYGGKGHIDTKKIILTKP